MPFFIGLSHYPIRYYLLSTKKPGEYPGFKSLFQNQLDHCWPSDDAQY